MSLESSSSDDAGMQALFWGSCDDEDEEEQQQQQQKKKKKRRVQQTLTDGPPPARAWVQGRLLRQDEELEEHVPARLLLNVLDEDDADELLEELLVLGRTWVFEKSEMFGKVIQTRRKTKTLKEEQMPPAMLRAKQAVQSIIHAQGFKQWTATHAVCNIYEDEDAQVASHNDRMDTIGPMALIGGLSLGARREFTFIESAPSKRKVVVELPHNSLVLMLPGCQEGWKHSIERMQSVSLEHPKVGRLRVSITLRMAMPHLPRPTCFCDVPVQPLLKVIVDPLNQNYGKHFWSCGRKAYSLAGEQPCNLWKIFDYKEWNEIAKNST